MQRRTFMAGLGAMFALAGVSRASVEPISKRINFNPWVDPERFRSRNSFDIGKPWEHCGKIVASDGRKLLRVHENPGVSLNEERVVPNIDFLPFDTFNQNEGWKRFNPKVHELVDRDDLPCIACVECYGLGYVGDVAFQKVDYRLQPKEIRDQYVKEMNDEELYFDLSDISQVASCIDVIDKMTDGWIREQWYSDTPCPRCNRQGYLTRGTIHEVDGVYFESAFIKALTDLGEFEYQIESFDRGDISFHGRLLLFRGNGFDGMILNRRFA